MKPTYRNNKDGTLTVWIWAMVEEKEKIILEIKVYEDGRTFIQKKQ